MKRLPPWSLEKMYQVWKSIDEEPCNCEHALLLQQCVHRLLDWLDSDEASDLPSIELFDICVKASHWREP